MKEILFRGKTENGEWADGFVQISQNGIACIFPMGDFIGIKVIPETIGQFTGLYDRNGTKVFEGDIVKTKYGRLCFVEWRSTPCFCGFDLMVYANWDDFDKAPSSWDLYMPQNLEIVGNIHDNKELLGE